MDWEKEYDCCELCPRDCRVNRKEATGFCGCKHTVRAARAALHQWEEPCISGNRGSGTVFFSGCTLRCCFCQNYPISFQGFGKELTERQLADIFLDLQDQGAHNINLVTPTQYLPSVIRALDLSKHRLSIPIVYNCGGYEKVETVSALKDYVDIWLPDLKYHSSRLSEKYSHAADYFKKASEAIRQMVLQTGPLQYEETPPDNASAPLMKKGTIIRHMVLPGAKEDSLRLLHWIRDTLPAGWYCVSILSQYTPFFHSSDYPEINRRVTSYEYYKVVDAAIELGLTDGFMQKRSSAKEEYTPPFDLEGLS